ncbi:MAG TPA: alpha/beta hydrolase [Gemmatimonadaceae bacterium]|nr:alpha/beta hydrolase [Gemmatimonadaceae bacterium]
MTAFTRHAFASFDGTEISYLDSGNGDAVALLLHGFQVDGETNFGPAAQTLALMSMVTPPGVPAPALIDPAGAPGIAASLAAAGFRVLVPDMRGHGASGKPDTADGYRGRAMARDMVALLDRFGVERAHVLGYSMGTLTAAHLMAIAPARVRSVVLGGIGAAIVAGEPLHFPPEFPVPEWVPQPLTFPAFSEYVASVLDGSKPAEGFAVVYPHLCQVLGSNPLVMAAVMRGHLTDVVSPETLRAFERPVMVANGAGDVASLPSEQAFSQYVPALTFLRMRGDHLGAVLDPDFHAATIRHFQTS